MMSSSAKPACSSAVAMMPNAARACAAASPGWSDAPSGPASVVPETSHVSPYATARE